VAGYDSCISAVARRDIRCAVFVADVEVGDTKDTFVCHWVESAGMVHSSASRSSVSSLAVAETVVVGVVVERSPVMVVVEKERRASTRVVARCSPVAAAAVVVDGCTSVVVALIAVAVEDCMGVVVMQEDLEVEGGFGGRLGCQSSILLLPFCVPISLFS
jgi:hypothetical protein